MGEVYEAERTRPFRQRVAIKVVKRAAPEFVMRFHRERDILGKLNDDSIAKILDGGEAPDGSPYLVMEYVVGAPIDEYCNSRNLNTRERLALFADVCSAVHRAHVNSEPIIHKDLKPSNIFITENGTPKILDFGVAKLLGVQEISLTEPESRGLPLFSGSLQYASPEQAAALGG